MTRRNILLRIAYDGTNFCGWQRQPHQRSVQGSIEEALSTLCSMPIQIQGTSRTDAGVHALGQQANFFLASGIPTERIPLALNHLLAGAKRAVGAVGDIRILSATEVPDSFHARFDARGKRYRYQIHNGGEPDLFQRNYCYYVEKELDLAAMQQAAALIVGTRDFKCFQAAGGQEQKTTVRTIHGIDLKREGRKLILLVTGDGFLYNMVRILTGTLVEVGLGRREPAGIPEMLESLDRSRAGHTAPPQGLYLAEVFFNPINTVETNDTNGTLE